MTALHGWSTPVTRNWLEHMYLLGWRPAWGVQGMYMLRPHFSMVTGHGLDTHTAPGPRSSITDLVTSSQPPTPHCFFCYGGWFFPFFGLLHPEFLCFYLSAKHTLQYHRPMDYFLQSFSLLPLLHCSVVLFTHCQSEVASGDHPVPSSQSRPSFEIRAGCSGPCSAECLQSWSIYTTSLGNLFQQLTTLKVEKDFVISKQNFACCNSRPLLHALSLVFLVCLVPFSLRPPKRYRKIAVRFPLSFLFSRLRKKSSSFSRSFYLTSFSSLNILFRM